MDEKTFALGIMFMTIILIGTLIYLTSIVTSKGTINFEGNLVLGNSTITKASFNYEVSMPSYVVNDLIYHKEDNKQFIRWCIT